MIEMLNVPGFLGTGAPLYMDGMLLAVVLLPFLVYVGILSARWGLYDLHRWYQWGLFWIALFLFAAFDYGVRAEGGFRLPVLGTGWWPWMRFSFEILQLAVTTLTLLWWARTLSRAERHWRRHNLPGGYTLRHLRQGWWTAWGVFFSTLGAVWVYLLLYVFGA